MSEENEVQSDSETEESPAEKMMRETREGLFTAVPTDLPLIEKEFAALQRELYHMRIWIDALQLSSYAFVRQLAPTADTVSLFHGNVFYTIKEVLSRLGATDEEIHRYLFGEATEDDPAVVYATTCVELAVKAQQAQEAAVEMKKANDPLERLKKALEKAAEEERKKTAN